MILLRISAGSEIPSVSILKLFVDTSVSFLEREVIMPPFNEVEVYCFAQVGRSVHRSVGRSVGRYTKPCQDDNLTQNKAWTTKFGAYIHLGM